ncbi:MAG: hypothetical protein WKF54_08010 [Nocardioidaceae bacterium]
MATVSIDTGLEDFTAADLERCFTEPTASRRSAFERDRARIVHSGALRRALLRCSIGQGTRLVS